MLHAAELRLPAIKRAPLLSRTCSRLRSHPSVHTVCSHRLLTLVHTCCSQAPLLRPAYRTVLAVAERLGGLERTRLDFLRVFALSCINNQPKARGAVRLASADPHDLPVVTPALARTGTHLTISTHI